MIIPMQEKAHSIHTWIKRIFLIPFYLYKGLLSPYFGGSCIYTPTCSTYMIESVMKHGCIKGFIMGMARIFRCSGFFLGGSDPVPETWSWRILKDRYTVFRKNGKG